MNTKLATRTWVLLLGMIFSKAFGKGISRSNFVIVKVFVFAVYIVACEKENDFWERMPGFENQGINVLAISREDVIFAGVNEGLHYSQDHGAHWEKTDLDGWVSALAQGDSGYFYAANGGGSFYRSSDFGVSWQPAWYFGVAVDALIATKKGILFAGTGGHGVYRSSDRGASWTEVNSGLSRLNVFALAVNKDGHVLAGTNGGGVFKSVDNGDSWIHVEQGFTSFYPWCFAEDSRGYLYAGTEEGVIEAKGGVFMSTNGGNSWQITALELKSISCLTVGLQGNVYAGIGNVDLENKGKVYFSNDHGKIWYQLRSGMVTTVIQTLAVDSSGYLYAGCNNGLFRAKP